MAEYSKSQKKELRKLATLVYDRALSIELEKLEEEFRRWREGVIPPGVLASLIHEFHQKPDRYVYKSYVAQSARDMDRVCLFGLIADLLRREEVSEELFTAMGWEEKLKTWNRDIWDIPKSFMHDYVPPAGRAGEGKSCLGFRCADGLALEGLPRLEQMT
jgi:hypothetical protein